MFITAMAFLGFIKTEREDGEIRFESHADVQKQAHGGTDGCTVLLGTSCTSPCCRKRGGFSLQNSAGSSEEAVR